MKKVKSFFVKLKKLLQNIDFVRTNGIAYFVVVDKL